MFLPAKIMSSPIKSLKSSLIILIILFFLAFNISYPHISILSCTKALDLFLKVIFPTLFPMMIISNLLMKSGFFPLLDMIFKPFMVPLYKLPGHSSAAIILGIFGGYPLGAQVCASLKREGALTSFESEQLSAFATYSSPLFVISTVGAGFLGSAELGYTLYVCHILSGLMVGLLLRFFYKSELLVNNSTNKPNYPFFTSNSSNFLGNLFEAITKSTLTLVGIGGLVIIFYMFYEMIESSGIISFVTNLIAYIFNVQVDSLGYFSAIIAGFFEMSVGVFLLSSTTLALQTKCILLSFFIGFSGLCIITQSITILNKEKISCKRFILGKILHGFLAGLFTFIWFQISQ